MIDPLVDEVFNGNELAPFWLLTLGYFSACSLAVAGWVLVLWAWVAP